MLIPHHLQKIIGFKPSPLVRKPLPQHEEEVCTVLASSQQLRPKVAPFPPLVVLI